MNGADGIVGFQLSQSIEFMIKLKHNRWTYGKVGSRELSQQPSSRWLSVADVLLSR